MFKVNDMDFVIITIGTFLGATTGVVLFHVWFRLKHKKWIWVANREMREEIERLSKVD